LNFLAQLYATFEHDACFGAACQMPHNAVLKLMEDHSSSVDPGMKVLKDYFSTIYKSDERPESFKLNFPNRLPFEVNLPGALVLDGFTDIEPL
jgi:hypothetical protein